MAGATLSFQKRVDENARRSSLTARDNSLKPTTPPVNPRPIESQTFNSSQMVIQGFSQKRPPLDPLQRSQSAAAALQAAAIAAKKQKKENQMLPRERPSEAIVNAVKTTRPKELVTSEKSTKSVDSAVKAGASTLPPKSPKSDSYLTPTSQRSLIAADVITIQPKMITDSKRRGSDASFVTKSSVSIIQPKPSALADQIIASTSSTSAARTVSKRHQLPPQSPPPIDRESKFGVILTRSVSPSPERARNAPRFNSIYQNPVASVSEPTLSHPMLSPTQSSGKVYRPSPLSSIRHSSNWDSSSSPSFADSGAATAMSPRNASAVSLPTLPIYSDDGPVSRRRPVHLKATMRKEHKPRHEKKENQFQSGPVSISEAERKRYEGVWASNFKRSSFTLISGELECIDNLVVRELWMRSNLSREVLGHIWYLAFYLQWG